MQFLLQSTGIARMALGAGTTHHQSFKAQVVGKMKRFELYNGWIITGLTAFYKQEDLQILCVQNPKPDISDKEEFCTSSYAERGSRHLTGSLRLGKCSGTSSPNGEAEAAM